LTPRSSSAHSRLTSLLLMPSMPRVRTRASTLRVETPSTYASATTANRARSARRRGSSSQSGKYEPRRSLGISSSIVPARVSQARARWPLRYPVRSGVRSWGSAPSLAATSSSISASAIVLIAWRRKSTSPSWAAFPTCSSNAILSVAIVVVLPVDVRHQLEDHAMALAVKGLDLHHVSGHYWLGGRVVAEAVRSTPGRPPRRTSPVGWRPQRSSREHSGGARGSDGPQGAVAGSRPPSATRALTPLILPDPPRAAWALAPLPGGSSGPPRTPDHLAIGARRRSP
jgi:hypothetical protein